MLTYFITCFVVSEFVLVVVVGDVDVVVIQLVLGLPGHLVLLLQAPTGVREPRTHLVEKNDEI